MQFTTFATIATLFAAPLVSATGKTWIHNHCSYDVYLWSVDADGSSEPIVIKAGDKYNETIRIPSVGGVSMKLSVDDSPQDPISQLEYTLTDKLWYDFSNVNCQGEKCPFCTHGVYMESGADCPTRKCGPMEIPCEGAYTLFNDDRNSLACAAQSDLTLLLCRDTPMSDDEVTKPVTVIEASGQEYGVPAHRRKTRRHGHPHWRH